MSLTAELFVGVVLTVDHAVADLPLQELGVQPVGAGAVALVAAVVALQQRVAAGEGGHAVAGVTAPELTPARAPAASFRRSPVCRPPRQQIQYSSSDKGYSGIVRI